MKKQHIEFLIQVCKNEIESNKSLITDLKNTDEIKVWKEENKFIEQVIKELKR